MQEGEFKEYSEDSGNPIQDKPNAEVASLFRERIKLLRSIIEEINAEIRKRKALRNGVLREIEEELQRLSISMSEVAPMGYVSVTGKYDENVHWRRIHLEKSIARLNELKRTHKIETWKDIVALKRELYKLLPEYAQLSKLEKMLD